MQHCCSRTSTLQVLIVESPKTLRTADWRQHLQHCSECQQEIARLNKSLELYIQLDPQQASSPDVDVWDRIQPQVESWHRWRFFSRKSLIIAAAVCALVVISVGIWPILQNPTPALSGKSSYEIQEIQLGQPFGQSFAQTQVIWNNQQFGISVKNKLEGNYASISIGMRLPAEYAQTELPTVEQPFRSMVAAVSTPEALLKSKTER